MGKNYNINNDVNIIKKLVIFTEFLVFLLVIGSSIAMASAGFPEENKPISAPTDHKFIHKDIVNQTEFSPKIGLAPENPKFIKYRNNESAYKAARSFVGHISGFAPSLWTLVTSNILQSQTRMLQQTHLFQLPMTYEL